MRIVGLGPLPLHLMCPAMTFSGRCSHSKQIGDGRRLDLAVFDAAMRKGVDLVSRHGRLFFFTRVFMVTPTGVRNVLRKFVGEANCRP
jgi:hypothetical protein